MEFKHSTSRQDYESALEFMETRVGGIRAKEKDEMVWFLEHPSLYTAGTSAKEADLLDARFPVYKAGRGGEYTYHGPGQRVCYVMLDLKKRQNVPDIKKYVWQLEEWIIKSLASFDINAERRDGRIGIWVIDQLGREAKIAALGVRVRHWVSYHGVAINVNPELSHFNGIIPCGISEYGVTSMSALLGREVELDELDQALKHNWYQIFPDQALAA